MRYLFGRFPLRIDGNETIVNRISSRYQKYLDVDHGSDSAYVLRFELIACDEYEEHLSEGWNVISENGETVYSANGKMMFALRNDETIQETIVSVCDNWSDSIWLGMQFGTLLALRHDCIGLHGVTLLCGNKIVILSAPSGTGKTTLAGLLEEYADAIVINGDFAMLSVDQDHVFFEPTPFCGSSRRCLNQRVRIDQVVFLEQAKKNEWKNLDDRAAMTRFMNNTFVPTWDRALLQTIQNNVLKIVSAIPVSSFGFAPFPKAAEDFMKSMNQ